MLRDYSANNIDKLNLLTFKSSAPLASANDANDDVTDNATATAAAIRSSSKSPTTTDADQAIVSAEVDVDETANAAELSANVDQQQPGASGSNSATMNAGGDKKFVLPHRSAHSSREIIPNKRYVEQQTGSGKSGKKGKKASGTGSSRSEPADNFINNTLSTQISSSKLLDEDEEDAEAGAQKKHKIAAAVVKSDHSVESESRSESEDNVTG